MPRELSPAQAERQRDGRHPHSGRYTQHHRCEDCGKNAGPDYYSAPNCNETGKGVVLCEACAAKY